MHGRSVQSATHAFATNPCAPSRNPTEARKLLRAKCASNVCVARVAPQRLRVVYSHSKMKAAIASQELASLLEDEWRQPLPVDRLALAVSNSTAIVAAFTREMSLLQRDSGSGINPFSRRSPLVLIGFARASSDRAFAGTIHNLIVHPLARRQGIGTKLLSRLTHQLKLGGVTDIGMQAPPSSIKFLLKAEFEEDREVTTPMSLRCGKRPLGRIVP